MAKKPDPFMVDEENPAWTHAKPPKPDRLARFSRAVRDLETPWPATGRDTQGAYRFPSRDGRCRGVRAFGRGYNARVEKVLREAIAKGLL